MESRQEAEKITKKQNVYFHFLDCILGTVLKDLRSISFFDWVFFCFLCHTKAYLKDRLRCTHVVESPACTCFD